MICLHCGDCCLRMSPKTHSKCPDVIQIDNFYFCNDYENRPTECVNHNFPYKYCPLGVDVCRIENSDQLRQRIDRGCELIKEILQTKLINSWKIS